VTPTKLMKAASSALAALVALTLLRVLQLLASTRKLALRMITSLSSLNARVDSTIRPTCSRDPSFARKLQLTDLLLPKSPFALAQLVNSLTLLACARAANLATLSLKANANKLSAALLPF
jgi:hypothetical protein